MPDLSGILLLFHLDHTQIESKLEELTVPTLVPTEKRVQLTAAFPRKPVGYLPWIKQRSDTSQQRA
jgi:hypothetical protein